MEWNDAFLGTRLQNVREKRKLTSKQAASLIGVSPSTWSLYESSNRTPSVNTLRIIATKLEVSSDYLLGLKNELN